MTLSLERLLLSRYLEILVLVSLAWVLRGEIIQNENLHHFNMLNNKDFDSESYLVFDFLGCSEFFKPINATLVEIFSLKLPKPNHKQQAQSYTFLRSLGKPNSLIAEWLKNPKKACSIHG